MATYTNPNGGGNNLNVSMISNATRFIITILVKYQKLNDTRLEQKEKQVILNELLHINVVDLIDNFNLVLHESTSYNKLEATYHMILYQINNISADNLHSLSNSARMKLFSDSACTVSICKMQQRNNRDRITSYSMSQLYYNVKDDAHIIILQLLDKMHCFFMHSFDVCLKWTKSETNYIYNTSHDAHATNVDMEIGPMLQRIKENIDKKKQNISKTSARFDDNRYVTIATLNNQRKQDQNTASNEQKEKENSENHHNKHKSSTPLTGSGSAQTEDEPFTFGKRWRYSKKYQTSDANDPKNGGKYNEWFVSQKYTNLKREILSNALKKLTMLQWKHINNKADQFMKCTKIKQLKAEKDLNYGFEKDINISQNQSIQVQHIICILIYCNFSSIKNSLKDSYQPMNKYEQWKDVRSKHSEFANLARILTEAVESFGDLAADQSNKQSIFYHCVLGAYKLHSLQARFFVPTSMTKELSVVSYYCYNTINLERYTDGLIIGLTANHSSDLKYFDCSFLSDFTNEYEVIFLGGKNTLYFHSIYDIKQMQNYQYYLCAIEMIEECFIQHKNRNNNINQYLFNAFKKCIYNQTQETVCVPPQIDYYLNSWCISRSTITVNMTNIVQAHNGYLKQLLSESQLLTKYDDNVYCILIDSLCRLFPNANMIHILEPIIDKKCEMFSQFHQFLASQMFYSCALTEIHLLSPTFMAITANISAKDIIQSQISHYFKSGWSIEQSATSLNDYVIKRLPQRRSHTKSRSSPGVANNEDPFGFRMDQVHKSSGYILSEGGGDDLFDSETFDILSAAAATPINIKMRIRAPQKGGKDKLVDVEFPFAPEDNAQQVANELLADVGLPQEYLDAVLHTIHECTTKNAAHSYKADPNIVVSFSYDAVAPTSSINSMTNSVIAPNLMTHYSAEHTPEKSIQNDNIQHVQNVQNMQNMQNMQNVQNIEAHALNVVHEESSTTNMTMNSFGPTMDQKRGLQQQQNIIKQKHVSINEAVAVPVTHIHQQASAPNAVIRSSYTQGNKAVRQQAQSTGQIFNTQKQTQSQPQIHNMNMTMNRGQSQPLTIEEQRRVTQEGITLFNTPLILASFDKYSFPASSVQLLDGKQAEFHAEYKAFLKTQSQIFNLKLEHIQIADGDPGNYENEKQQLLKSMEEKIELKKKELTGKWDEFVQDQKELNELKQQISAKHLIQFKQQLHFEQHEDYQQIIKSDKISENDKVELRTKLTEFREKMIEDYKIFRENHYGKYDNKLKEKQKQQTTTINQYMTQQQQQTMHQQQQPQ